MESSKKSWVAENWYWVFVVLALLIVWVGVGFLDHSMNQPIVTPARYTPCEPAGNLTTNFTTGCREIRIHELAVLGPHLNVTTSPAEVQAFQTETIVVSSYVATAGPNNTVIRTASPGPVEISMIDSTNKKLSEGCAHCNLTFGATGLNIFLDTNFDSQSSIGVCPVMYVGQINVAVRDLATSATAFGIFTIGLSPEYQGYLTRCRDDALNRSAANAINQVLGVANVTVWSGVFGTFALAVLVILLTAHREARRHRTWSWYDGVKYRSKIHLFDNPLNLWLDEHRTWSKETIYEIRKMNEGQRVMWLRREILEHSQLLEALSEAVGAREDYARKLKDLRTPQGLDERTFLDRYAPATDDFTGKNKGVRPGLYDRVRP
jgi:hypothetical protein